MKPENAIISHNIKLLRKKEGLSMEEFGKKYGSNQKSLWTYEHGICKPKHGFLLQLSKGVGISPDLLISIKLKQDRTGKIINLPSKELRVQSIRSDFKMLVNEYKKATDTFLKGIMQVNERLDAIEKK